MNEVFPIDYKSILERVDRVDPSAYRRTRNFTDGAVSYLSPYISRGVISINQVRNSVLKRGLKAYQTERFIQELLWREYWQRVWQDLGDKLFADIKHVQPDVVNYQMPVAVNEANTGIKIMDDMIENLYESGYMHNHVRMYTAAICCNIAKSHWMQPSRWLYYHLLDGDLASNMLSWQWVAGSFSNKKYYCTQDNINRYTHSEQKETFLDRPYAELVKMDVPDILTKTKVSEYRTIFPKTKQPVIDKEISTLIYNSYNLDPEWRKNEKVNRILLLEPSHFKKHSVSEKVLKFILELSENISGIQIYTGEFNELKMLSDKLIYKEHPAFRHYEGTEDSRDWIAPDVTGYFASYFTFYKRVVKSLKANNTKYGADLH
jgi:deoxyribodipyrimidine photo-lyase